MTLAQKALGRERFAALAPIAGDAAALFCRRLFEVDPSLRSLFRGDMGEQRKS